jgi:phosphate transport system substrate-binding protein
MTKNSISINLALALGLFLTITFSSCGSGGNSQRNDLDSGDSGRIHISVDESFKPVIDSEIQVYEALHPKTQIIAEYKPEAECLKDLQKDSTRMIIITRPLNTTEERFFKDKLSYFPPSGLVAYDAVAIVVNRKSPDSILYQANLRSILDGSIGGNKKVIFDGVSGSSVFRYVKDSVLRGRPLDSTRAFGVDGSEEVLKRVEEDKNLIGLVGVSWIGNPEDTTQLSFLMKVRTAAIDCRCPEKTFVKPYQYNILTFRYPYVRGIYYIFKENYPGLGSAFANFLESERGQLIFKRAYLGPAKINFTVREANY